MQVWIIYPSNYSFREMVWRFKVVKYIIVRNPNLTGFYYYYYYFYFYCFFFPRYSIGTQLYIHVYIIFSPIVVLQSKYLDIVLSATQQDLIVSPFQVQQFASVNPKLPIPPTSSPLTPGKHKSVLQVHDFLFCGNVERLICAVYQVPDISDIIQYLSFSF